MCVTERASRFRKARADRAPRDPGGSGTAHPPIHIHTHGNHHHHHRHGSRMGAAPSIPTDPSRTVQVIGAGFSRTGTVSMQMALEILLKGPVLHGGTQLVAREDGMSCSVLSHAGLYVLSVSRLLSRYSSTHEVIWNANPWGLRGLVMQSLSGILSRKDEISPSRANTTCLHHELLHHPKHSSLCIYTRTSLRNIR